ncbi:uncharacterized protein ACA1_031880 [Acanthamoeba castellanii str. Neff]|jgi:hypothetical protein|uniref:Uncharacterized protein n=1 Tax=Acanthamoeba castellanii (strain ATCC 30010 / Neff) TaxID=1257118 RepID=L8H110_ACACF|nr:uncharacterized protein ACA1_031880 [Acanthamoeba castellanii str. Neff]ELR19164.1 hypothetical protein ACA1_031880 [Acanthamoeba castellanii str. Neff]
MRNSAAVVLLLLAALVAVGSCVQCYEDNLYKPTAVMTWGFDGFQSSSPGARNIQGWQIISALTGQTIDQTRREALDFYAERYGFNNTVLSYDPTTGVSVLPQGTMLPVYLTAQGDYGLWADSDKHVVDQRCPHIAVIEWVLFTSASTAGTVYNGTYGAWYKIRNPAGSRVSVGDVVSSGRYLINGTKKHDEPLVLSFKTLYPVRLDGEHTYRVDNVISHPDLGLGSGQSNYRYYLAAGTTSTWFVQIRNTIKWPYIEAPPIDPTSP